MESPFFQIDAFTDQCFSGNPAAVMPLEAWLKDEVLQQIACENNLSETAFFRNRSELGQYDLRWFTPGAEVDLCGHATLATAHCLWHELQETAETLTFHTRSGRLLVSRTDSGYEMDFPAQPPVPVSPTPDPISLIGVAGTVVGRAADLLIRVEHEATVAALRPNMGAIAAIPYRGLIVTAPADDGDTDFASRFFAPQVGVPEDPVTGSAHCCLGPYWAEELGKSHLVARQIGPRGGKLRVHCHGERVTLIGQAVTVIRGSFLIPE